MTRRSVVLALVGASLLALAPVQLSASSAHVAASRRIELAAHGPWGGSVSSIVSIPGRPKILFASVSGAGVYRSSNGGRSWSRSSSGLPIEPRIGILAVARARPPQLYVVTGQGLFKSNRGGRYWALVKRAKNISEVAANPRHPNTVFASDDSHTYRSTDGGQDWSVVLDSEGEDVTSANIEIAPSDPNTVYAFSADAFLRSHDRGATWVEIPRDERRPTNLVVDPRHRATLYSTSISGIKKSVDGGSTWTLSKDPRGEILGPAAIDPKHPRHVIVGGLGGCFVTKDGGDTWRRQPTKVGAMTSLVIPWGDGRVVAGFDEEGVGISRNGGRTWALSNRGLEGASIMSLVAPKANVAYASVLGLGVARTTDGGRTWRYPAGTGGSIYRRTVVDLAAAPGSDVVYGLSGRGLIRSNDGARTWRKIYRDRYRVLGFAQAPSRPRTLYLSMLTANGKKGIIKRSLNGGRTWLRMGTSIYEPSTFYVHPRHPNVLYMPLGSGTARSINGGRTWHLGNQDYFDILSLALDPLRPIVYTSGVSTPYIYKSSDNGAHFRKMTNGLRGTFITGLAIDPRYRRTLYAGSDDPRTAARVFRTTNGGRRWRLASSALPSNGITVMALNPGGTRLYVGTRYDGIFAGHT